jgi:hypothetical protein
MVGRQRDNLSIVKNRQIDKRLYSLNHRHEKIIQYRPPPPPAPSTCDFIYSRQRPPLNYGGQKQKDYLTPFTPQLFLPRRAALRTQFKWDTVCT